METKETVVKSVRMRKKLSDIIFKMAKKENRNFSNMCETLLIKALNDNQHNGNENR